MLMNEWKNKDILTFIFKYKAMGQGPVQDMDMKVPNEKKCLPPDQKFLLSLHSRVVVFIRIGHVIYAFGFIWI